MEYPDIAIKALINCINDDETAYDWLVKSEWKELAALADYFCSGNTQALTYLLKNKTTYGTLVNFLAALQKEDKAFELLMSSKEKQWAAVVAAAHGDEDAYQWLIDNNFETYAGLAEILIQKSSSGGGFGISGGGSGFGGGSGGGFGGFGGGGFGGAGSGGSW